MMMQTVIEENLIRVFRRVSRRAGHRRRARFHGCVRGEADELCARTRTVRRLLDK